MKLIADLHIHSPYSRATSSRLTPPYLDRWARIKGINLLGSGDCTHPLWLEELRRQLDETEEGCFTLKEELRSAFNAGQALIEGLPLPPHECEPASPRFVLTGEIATIYKYADKVRKIHQIVILPDFRAAAAFNARLEGLGANIRSDGRPILGMDSRDLLALLLDVDERSMLIPAHIWTPWFSVLGAKSGFDSVEECYRDLTPSITAIETGLSSNPPMNWAVESLDKFSVISNSDAHSPEKLGREATIFDMELSFPALRQALSSNAILGTVEFFPQEGKYHYDGHRKCSLSLEPGEAKAGNYICPVCARGLTRGVMGRVLELASRPVNEEEKCPADYAGTNRRPYHSLIPLKEIISELLGTGAASKKADAAYCRLVEKAGSEFSILMDLSRSDLEKIKIPELSTELLAEAITKMREGDVSVNPGYDGEYGKVRVFASVPDREKSLFEKTLVSQEAHAKTQRRKVEFKTPLKPSPLSVFAASRAEFQVMPKEFVLDAEQEKIVSHNGNTAIIIAGPGTGKTRVLTERIRRLIRDGADPSSILALTFTVKAAAELQERIAHLCTEAAVTAATFHSFCCSVLREQTSKSGIDAAFRIIDENERDSLLREIGGRQGKRLKHYIEERKRFLLLPGEKFPDFLQTVMPLAQNAWEIPTLDAEMESLYAEYRTALKKINALDFEDLSMGIVRLFASRPEILEHYRRKFRCIFVDEYQDINFSQYMLIRLLTFNGDSSLWVIGDPNQAIYGFRGSDKRFIDRFLQDYPNAADFKLSRSFRCAGPIIKAAGLLSGISLAGQDLQNEVNLYRTLYASEKSEAEGIARTIAAMLGGTSFFAMDSGAAGVPGNMSRREHVPSELAPNDFAILVRAAALACPIVKALNDHGIPFQLCTEKPWLEELQIMTGVNILTIHASKGLEFEQVFVPGLEEGILPFTLFGKTDDEEERRLLYVAMTRAKNGLWLSCSQSRNFKGRKLKGEPSRFLSELEKIIPLAREDKSWVKKWDGQLSLF